MNNIHRAMRVARRYAEGGSDDSDIDPIVSIGGKPIANRPPPEALPPLPDNPDQKYAMPEESFTHGYEREFGPIQDWRNPTHRGVSDVVGGMGQDVTRPTAEGPTVQNVAGAAMAMPIVPPSAEGAAAEIGARATRKALAKDVAGQLVERYGDNHAAISERMLSLDPQDHNDVLAHLPPSVRSGVIDHRLNEANRILNPEPTPEPPRQPGASRTGYVSPYGIHGGQAQLSDQEYEALNHPEQLSQFEGENTLSNDIPTGRHPFSKMDGSSWDNYQKFIQPRLGAPHDFAKDFFAGYDTRGISVGDGSQYGYAPGSIDFSGRLIDKGKKVADISASIIPGTNSAHLGLLEVEPQYRGTAGPKLLRNQIDTYRKLGLKYVDLLAAGDDMNTFNSGHYGGSYAWAKYGFTPTPAYWSRLRGTYLDLLRSGEIAPANHEDAVIARNILSSSDPRAIWRLADMKSPMADGRPYGKTLLLTESWGGQLTFKDPTAMRRFDAYIARPKKPTQ